MDVSASAGAKAKAVEKMAASFPKVANTAGVITSKVPKAKVVEKVENPLAKEGLAKAKARTKQEATESLKKQLAEKVEAVDAAVALKRDVVARAKAKKGRKAPKSAVAAVPAAAKPPG